MAKKQEKEDLDLDAGSPRVYELGFHLDPQLSADEARKSYQEIRKAVEAAGDMVAEGEPQKIALAYTISRQEPSGRRDFDSAYFAWIAYVATPEAHDGIIKTAHGNAHFVRFIDVLTDKDTVRAAVERAELAAKAPERTSEAEADTDEALDAALENAAAAA